MITGATELIAIIGSPITQVYSPTVFNEYFRRAGLDVAMIAMDVELDALDSCVDLIRGWQNLLGCVVTAPYKRAFALRVDALSDRANALGSVNVVRREVDGYLVADAVDGLGFLIAARHHGFDPRGQRALVIGAGGAGSAIAYALCEAGAAELTVLDMARDHQERLAEILNNRFPSTRVLCRCESLSSLDLIVNATPVGMADNLTLPLAIPLLKTLQLAALVADIVTKPPITPLLTIAMGKGCRVQTGPEMARAQFELLGVALGVMPATANYTPTFR